MLYMEFLSPSVPPSGILLFIYLFIKFVSIVY